MRPPLIATAGILCALIATAAYSSPPAQEFVRKASVANKFEIDSSKLALSKSQNSDIKSFAQQMIDDHGKTGEKLKDALKNSKSGAKPATELDSKHIGLIDKLNSINGDEFDNYYISMQTDAHEESVKLFSEYADNGEDAALKQFAADTLPMLKIHKEHVEQLDTKH